MEENDKKGLTIEDINKKYGPELEKEILEAREKERIAAQELARQKEREEIERKRKESQMKKLEYERLLQENGEKLEPKFEEFLKHCLFGEDVRLEESCWFIANSRSDDPMHNPFAFKKRSYSRPISVREAVLIKLGLGSVDKPEHIYLGGVDHDRANYYTYISSTSNLDERQKIQADLLKRCKEELKNKAEQLTDPDLDEKGNITFRYNDYPFDETTNLEKILSNLYGYNYDNTLWTNGDVERLGFSPSYGKSNWTTKENLVITMTKRELIKAGLDPELLGWRSLERKVQQVEKEVQQVEPKDIIVAEKEAKLPKKIIDSVKSFFDKMLSRGKVER